MSISLVGVPALLDTSTQAPEILRQWRRIYHYGHHIMPAVALSTCAMYSYAALQKRNTKNNNSWVLLGLAGLTTACIIPFTLTVMASVNGNLFRLEEASRVNPQVVGLEGAKDLLLEWSKFHIARSFIPLVGTIIGTFAAFRN